jgi:hypothetical protein
MKMILWRVTSGNAKAPCQLFEEFLDQGHWSHNSSPNPFIVADNFISRQL